MSSPVVSRSDVDEIIKKKRKVREHKACYPCRSRKVRCDSKIPCQTCIERNHAEICSWNPPPKRIDTGATHGSKLGAGSITFSSDEWERISAKINAMEKSLTELKQDIRKTTHDPGADTDLNETPTSSNDPKLEVTGPKYVKAMDINEESPLTGESVHLGGGSIPALVRALGRSSGVTPAVQEVFGTNVLPLFGLDNENATYPFVSLWGGVTTTAERVAELRKALPPDAECLETFRHYRDGGYVTFPGVVEIDRFENDLLVFLANRRSGRYDMDVSENSVYGNTLQWLALLFAVFASGAQFSTLPKEQRAIVSQLYGCCSFECLRLVNYLAHASLEIIQAMLVLGNVLANAMNAGAAWSFLGMTMRLAQSLGLHRSSEEAASSKTHKTSSINLFARSRTWWAILWQDSNLSLSYDRASSAAAADSPYPPNENPNGGFSYHEAMYRVCKVGLDTIRNRVAPQSIESRLTKCSKLRDEVQRAQDSALEHLRNLESCRSIKDQSEYWMLSLHAAYMKSELCRPAISPSTSDFEESKELRQLCIDNLMKTVEAFVGVCNVSPLHTRSWTVAQRALSSALLLGLLREPLKNPDTQTLLEKLVVVMENPAVHGNSEPSLPIQRSITAIRKLAALGNKTPLTPRQHPLLAKLPYDPTINYDQINGANLLNFSTGSSGIPSPFPGFDEESSPYALMDSIIWGGERQPLNN